MALASSYRAQRTKYLAYLAQTRKMYEQKPGVRTSLELILTLLTISFFTFFALRPTLNTIAELLANIRVQRETLRQLDEKVAKLRQAQEIWSQEEGRISLLDQALPQKAEPDQYLRQVEGLVAKHGLSFKTFNIEEVPLVEKGQEGKSVGGPVQEMKVTIAINGSYDSLLAFLRELELLRRTVRIESFTFGESRTEEGALLLTVSSSVPYGP